MCSCGKMNLWDDSMARWGSSGSKVVRRMMFAVIEVQPLEKEGHVMGSCHALDALDFQ